MKTNVNAAKTSSIPSAESQATVALSAARFQLGQSVKAVGFVDCFGKTIPERNGLTVSEVRLIECSTMKPYFRVKADDADGFGYVEGAERYFAEQF